MENKFKSLDRKMKLVWLIEGIIAFVLFLIVSLVIIFLVEKEYLLPTILTCSILLLILAILCIVVPLLKYKYTKYYYDEKRICINQGIIFRKRIIIPICQIQDLHLYQGPIMLATKLSGVTISTAGSNYNIIGLSNNDAIKMIEDLEDDLQKRIEDAKYE